MLKFFSGLVTGILVVVITVVCCLFAVPIDSFTNMAGMEMPEGTEIKGMSIVDAGKTAINMVQNLNTKSLNDIKKTFGVDVFAIVKNALNMDPNDTSFDAVADAKFPDIGTEVTKIPVQNMLTIAGIELNANIMDVIEPMLGSSIFELTDPTQEQKSQEIINNVISGITIGNVREFGPEILPNIPLFKVENNNKELLGLFKDPSKLKVGDFVDTSIAGTAKVLVAIKDCTLLPDKANPDMYIANKIMNIPVQEIMPDSIASNPVLDSIKTKTINELANDEVLNKITIGEILGVVETDETKPAVLRAIANITIGEITKDPTNVIKTALDTVKIGDIVPIEKDSLLDKLNIANSTISTISTDIQDAIKNITIGEILPELNVENPTDLPAALKDKAGNYIGKWKVSEITTKTHEAIEEIEIGVIFKDIEETKIPGSLEVEKADGTISKFKDWKLSELQKNMTEAVDTMDITDLFGNPIEGTLLYTITHDGAGNKIVVTLTDSKKENQFTIEERMQVVIGEATLNNMRSWGILGKEVDTALSTKLGKLGVLAGLTAEATLGDLKIPQVITVVAKAIESINKIP